MADTCTDHLDSHLTHFWRRDLNCFYDSGLGSLPCYCASAGYRLGIVEKDIVIEPFIYALMLIYSDVILCYGRYVITYRSSVEHGAFFRHVIDSCCVQFFCSFWKPRLLLKR